MLRFALASALAATAALPAVVPPRLLGGFAGNGRRFRHGPGLLYGFRRGLFAVGSADLGKRRRRAAFRADSACETAQKFADGVRESLGERGGTVVVDELDAKLHPKLLRYVILLFKDPEVNKHGAQLIFSSQDVSTMRNDVFRRDEIWFAARGEGEASQLWSLADIHEANGNLVSKNAAFDKQYLSGRYGADPYLTRIEEWD